MDDAIMTRLYGFHGSRANDVYNATRFPERRYHVTGVDGFTRTLAGELASVDNSGPRPYDTYDGYGARANPWHDERDQRREAHRVRGGGARQRASSCEAAMASPVRTPDKPAAVTGSVPLRRSMHQEMRMPNADLVADDEPCATRRLLSRGPSRQAGTHAFRQAGTHIEPVARVHLSNCEGLATQSRPAQTYPLRVLPGKASTVPNDTQSSSPCTGNAPRARQRGMPSVADTQGHERAETTCYRFGSVTLYITDSVATSGNAIGNHAGAARHRR
ncbi:hypothetical protein JOE11_003251 [Robbsia andropogonis]